MGKYLRLQNIIFIFFLLLAIVRLSLLGRGAFAFYDETRYQSAIIALQKLKALDVPGFCSAITCSPHSYESNPGFPLINLLPAAVRLYIQGAYDIPVDNPESLLVAQLFNLLISIIIAYIFYKISFLIFNSDWKYALIATIIFSGLANNNIYIRHTLPYDAALLCFLFALFYFLKKARSNENKLRPYFITGIISAFGFATYPGFYFFTVLFPALIIFYKNGTSVNKKIKKVFSYSVGAICTLLFFEAVSRLGHTSYVANNFSLMHTITQGSFSEGYVFLPKYLIQNEKFAGTFLLLLSGLFFIGSIRSIIKKDFSYFGNLHLVKTMFFIMAAGYFFHASLAVAFHKVVFYGRLLHIYFPFLIWGSIALVSKLKSQRIMRGVLILFVSLSVFSFVHFFLNYKNLAYPRDVLYTNRVNTANVAQGNFICESPPHDSIWSPAAKNLKTLEPYSAEKNFIVVNSCYFYPIDENFKSYKAPQSAKLVFSGTHFLNFLPYEFEGFSIEERALLQQRMYKVFIYRVNSMTITGSLFFDKLHYEQGKGIGPGWIEKKNKVPTYWEITR